MDKEMILMSMLRPTKCNSCKYRRTYKGLGAPDDYNMSYCEKKYWEGGLIDTDYDLPFNTQWDRCPDFEFKPEIERVISVLQGTCNTMTEALQQLYGDVGTEDNFTAEDYEAISLEIFKCDHCDWWYEISERASDQDDEICEGCADSVET